MLRADIEIESADGTIGTYVVRPEGDGPFPVVLFLMDAPGKRRLLHQMADRIASNGYCVMLPNLYYRATASFELDFSSKESFQQMVELTKFVGNCKIATDAGVLLAHATGDPAADVSRVGCVGYCMSGPFSIWVAAEYPQQVKAAASFNIDARWPRTAVHWPPICTPSTPNSHSTADDGVSSAESVDAAIHER